VTEKKVQVGARPTNNTESRGIQHRNKREDWAALQHLAPFLTKGMIMSVERKLVGLPSQYKGHKIETRHMGPDLLCYVDGTEMPNFYLNAEAVRKGGMRYIDQIEAEKEKASCK
jgi:hypothetical protein